jgi:hypothetical protein
VILHNLTKAGQRVEIVVTPGRIQQSRNILLFLGETGGAIKYKSP